MHTHQLQQNGSLSVNRLNAETLSLFFSTFSLHFPITPLHSIPLLLLSLILLSSMYIFGGFSGLLLNDVLAYTLPSCLAFSTSTLCAAAGPGLRCHWLNGGCLPWEFKAPEHTLFRPAFCPARPGMQKSPASLFSSACLNIFTVTRRWSPQRANFFKRTLIILKDLASEVCLRSIIVGTGGHRSNNYLILK